jgi:hypothetical protein
VWIGNGNTDPLWTFGTSREKERGGISCKYKVLLHQVRVRVVGEPSEIILLDSPLSLPVNKISQSNKVRIYEQMWSYQEKILHNTSTKIRWVLS